MFILVTEAWPQTEDLSSITKYFDKDHILWFEVPASNENVKNGKAIARFVTEKEFKEGFIMENTYMEKRYRTESNNVEKWLKEFYGSIVNLE